MNNGSKIVLVLAVVSTAINGSVLLGSASPSQRRAATRGLLMTGVSLALQAFANKLNRELVSAPPVTPAPWQTETLRTGNPFSVALDIPTMTGQ